MIRADAPANVKLRNLLRKALPLVLIFSCTELAAGTSSTRTDVREMEDQEFGISKGFKEEKNSVGATTGSASADALETTPEVAESEVKPIEAEEFSVRLIRKSTSGRVLLLEDATESQPRPGKILLLKEGSSDVVALRVLKNYSGRFAGKIVLNFKTPSLNSEYRALRKLSDKLLRMIREREKRGRPWNAQQSDEDLSHEIEPNDNELDRGIPLPKPKAKAGSGGATDGHATQSKKSLPAPLFAQDGSELDTDEFTDLDEDGSESVAVQESPSLERRHHAVSAEYASIQNVDRDSNAQSYSSIGIRYAYNFWHQPFVTGGKIQDMFSAEISGFFYNIAGFAQTDDSVSVTNLGGTVRYNILIGESLMPYVYLGVTRNIVTSVPDSAQEQALLLATTRAVYGIGTMLKLGPGWALRADLGNDVFGFGAVLKF